MKKKLVMSLAAALVFGAIATSGAVDSVAAEIAKIATAVDATAVDATAVDATAVDAVGTPVDATAVDATAVDATAEDAKEAVKEQDIDVLAKSKTLKSSKLAKKNQKFTLKAVAEGDVTFKKVSGNKNITVAKNGAVTVKKGLKKGTYKYTVKISAKATEGVAAATKKVTFKVVVK